MFVICPVTVEATLNVALIVIEPAGATVPRLHGNPPVQGAVAETYANPAGAGSVNVTFVAGALPVLLTVIAYTIEPPAVVVAGPVF